MNCCTRAFERNGGGKGYNYIIIASDHEPNQFTMDDLNAVEKCLLRGEYPRQLHEGGEGQLYRRQCRSNFQLADGILKYRTTMKPGKEEEEWRVCIQTEEKTRIFGKLPWRIGWYNYG